MIDRLWLKENADKFDKAMLKRGLGSQSAELLALDEDWRKVQAQLEECLATRNRVSAMIASAGSERAKMVAQMQELKVRIGELEKASSDAKAKMDAAFSEIPNPVASGVPDGASEDDNVVLKQHGQARAFDFPCRSHDDLGVALGVLDFAGAAQISGSRFAIQRGALARLERALANYFLDKHATKGYTEYVVPLLVKESTVFGTGQLPKFGDDLFSTSDGRYLIPTAEVTLTNFARNRRFTAKDLPLRFTAYSNCFRSEAGSAGKDTKGLIRLHQFTKVELVSVAHPDESDNELERMVKIAEAILEELELPYQRVAICGGDIGFSSRQTFDLEVWMPHQDKYREISSCSNCGDFQAVRMDARLDGDSKNRWVHTLNGSALPLGRTIAAILENYQQSDGSVEIPKVLQKYCGFDRIDKPK